MSRNAAAMAMLCLAVPLLAVPAAGQEAGELPGAYVVNDPVAGAIVLITRDGARTVLLDGLADPRGVTVDPDRGYVLAVDGGTAPGTGRIYFLEAGEAPVEVLVDLDAPRQAAFGPEGNVYFVSAASPAVLRLDPDTGEIAEVAVIDGEPSGLALAADGASFVVATVLGRGVRVELATGDVTPITEPLRGGGQVAADPAVGNCFAEADAGAVSCWPPGGGDPVVFGRLDRPLGVAATANAVVVAGNGGLRVLDPADGSRLGVLPDVVGATSVAVLPDPGPWLAAAAGPPPTTLPLVTAAPAETAAPATTARVAAPTTTRTPVAAAPDDDGGSAGWMLVGLALAGLAVVAGLGLLGIKRRAHR